VTKAAASLALAGALFQPALKPPPAHAQLAHSALALPSVATAEKVVKQGMYRDYEIDAKELQQKYDDPTSKYQTKEKTKKGKGKYVSFIGVLTVGSFIIPMAQYFWYVRDDDSSDNFFAQKGVQTPPPPPPKKKGFFGK
jgi:hypothetical protein